MAEMTEKEQTTEVQKQLNAVLTEASKTYSDRVALAALVTIAASIVAKNELVGIPALSCWHRCFSMTYDAAYYGSAIVVVRGPQGEPN